MTVGQLLAKRKAGAPLSDAEHAQRVAAAKARWTAAAGLAGTVAAAAAGFGTAHAIGKVRAAARSQVLQGVRSVRAQAEFNDARIVRQVAKERAVTRGVTPSGTAPYQRQVPKTMRSMLRRAELEAAGERAAAGPLLHDPTANLDNLAWAESRVGNLRSRLAELKAKGRPDRHTPVEAAKPHPVRGFKQVRKGKPTIMWEPFADVKLAHLMDTLSLPKPAADPTSTVDRTGSLIGMDKYVERIDRWTSAHTGLIRDDAMILAHATPRDVHGVLEHVRSLADVSALVEGMRKKDQDAYLKANHLPTFKTVRPERVVNYAPVPSRARPAGEKKVEGFPDRAGRRVLSEELVADVAMRGEAWRGREATAAAARLNPVRTAARAHALPSLKRLGFLAPRTRLGLIGGAAAAAGIGGYYAVRGTQAALGKAFEEEKHERAENGEFSAGGAAGAVAGGAATAAGATFAAGEAHRRARVAHIKRYRNATKGKSVVYRGAPVSDPNPQAREWGAVFVAKDRKVAREFARHDGHTSRYVLDPSMMTHPLDSRVAARIFAAGNADDPMRRIYSDMFRTNIGRPVTGNYTDGGKSFKEQFAYGGAEGVIQGKAALWNMSEKQRKMARRLGADVVEAPQLKRGDAFAVFNTARLKFVGSAPATAAPSLASKIGAAALKLTRRLHKAEGAGKLGKAFDPTQARDSHGRFAGAGPARSDFARGGDPPRVTMLIGMPGSGKSTWRAIGMARDAIRPTTIISTDDQVEDIGRQHGLSFSEAFKLLDHHEVDRGHRIALRAAIKAGNDVIIDRVNASRSGRARWLRQVPKHYEKHAVHFQVPEHVLRVRRANRPGKIIPDRALDEMRRAFKPPGPHEFDHVHRIRPRVDSTGALKKSSPESPRPLDAADKAEAQMAQRLAVMFGAWTDGAEEKLLGPDSPTLLTGMAADLDQALKPLDAAVRAGAAQPVLSGGEGPSVAFTFAGRSAAVTSFVDAYRQDRIAELVAEQKAAIKQQLIDAAKEGRSPDEMARRVRDTIGLTSTQMGHVNNYRDELENLKGGALVRQLRDRRYDSPITRAIDTGTAIPPEKIDQYVDAYHRKYLAYRAMVIARTEGVGGANNGQAAVAVMMADQHPGMVLQKTWIATHDDRTRDDHRELDGKSVVGIDTPFKCESGDLIRWPHDPRAPARQIIQCRCSWVTRLVPAPESPDSATTEQSEN